MENKDSKINKIYWENVMKVLYGKYNLNDTQIKYLSSRLKETKRIKEPQYLKDIQVIKKNQPIKEPKLIKYFKKWKDMRGLGKLEKDMRVLAEREMIINKEKIMENKENIEDILNEIVSAVDHDCSMGYSYKSSVKYFTDDLVGNYGITIDEEKKIKKTVYNCFKKELEEELELWKTTIEKK